jgi:O-antigen/teichoic acid export membrane protein
MSRLAKNVSANLLANAWSTALALLLTPWYVRLLGVESYGLIGFYVSWVAMLGILDTGISATALREIAWLWARPEERRHAGTLLRSLEGAYWGIMSLIGIALLLGAWWFGASWFKSAAIAPEVVRQALLLMTVSLIVQVPSGLYVAGLMGLQRQVECSALVAIFGTVRGLGAVAVLSAIQPDIRVFFLWQIAASAAQTVVMRSVLWRRIRTGDDRPRFSAAALQSVKEFAGGMTLLTALGVVLNQLDKMILSRFATLEALGYYMLAWTVASGLSRVATPLIQAFGPQFTELISRGDDDAAALQLRLASQLMSALILPPSAVVMFFSGPVLLAWIGNPAVAARAAPLLALLTVGTVLSVCSYPALSILYSRKRLRPVVVVNITALAILAPALVAAVIWYGALGAAACWAAYGLGIYIAYQTLGLSGLPGQGVAAATLRDFAAPGAVAFAAVAAARYWSGAINGTGELVAVLSAALLVGCLGSALACRDLLNAILVSLRWKTSSVL